MRRWRRGRWQLSWRVQQGRLTLRAWRERVWCVAAWGLREQISKTTSEKFTPHPHILRFLCISRRGRRLHGRQCPPLCLWCAWFGSHSCTPNGSKSGARGCHAALAALGHRPSLIFSHRPARSPWAKGPRRGGCPHTRANCPHQVLSTACTTHRRAPLRPSVPAGARPFWIPALLLCSISCACARQFHRSRHSKTPRPHP